MRSRESSPPDDGQRSRSTQHARPPQLLLSALLQFAACTSAHALPAVHVPSGHPHAPPPAHQAVLDQRLRATDTTAGQAWPRQQEDMHGSMHDDEEQYEMAEAYDIEHALVVGPVSDAEQAEFEAEYDAEAGQRGEYSNAYAWPESGDAAAYRGLLMRKPSRYNICTRCTILRCSKAGSCSGRCKRKRRLFNCVGRRDQKTCTRGGTPWQLRPDLLSPDQLGPMSSVVVTANVPYIGCANITGLPTGCPAPSTPGGTSNRFELLGSSCVQHQHFLDECESPYFPFGYCMCQYEFKISRGRTRIREIPCSSVGMGLDLELATAPAEDGGPDPLLSDLRVNLERDGADTITSFHDYGEETDGPAYSYNHTFSIRRRPDVNVKLEFFRTFYTQGSEFTSVGVVLPEYEDDPETLAYDELTEDYYFRSRYWDGTQNYSLEEECRYECQLEGAHVLDSITADGVTVIYESSFDCSHCYRDGMDEPPDEKLRPGSVIIIADGVPVPQ